MTIRLSLTMIVKNEAATLDRCLYSVQDLMDEIIIVDTGSHDDKLRITLNIEVRCAAVVQNGRSLRVA